MKILIDLQAAQTPGSKTRGIGRYSTALAKALAAGAHGHETWIALNSLFPDEIEEVRGVFDGIISQDRIVIWEVSGPVAEANSENHARLRVAEQIRESFLAQQNPDVIFVSSLFEGFGDDAHISVGASIPTAVTLYDLIPLIHRGHYLSNPVTERWYERKLQSLCRADLWLAISESSRKEGIERLNLPADRVINISTAANSMFKPVKFSKSKISDLRKRMGLRAAFIMYTGGIDHRKNIDRLIGAYAQLPEELRAANQLAIVCSATQDQISHLRNAALSRGLRENDVVFTGFVSDEDLLLLYNLCTAFVFPSWHEGFGLPALEAMSCGAAVIGSNLSSLPEVIGRPDALFNPFDESSIATKLRQTLEDAVFRKELKAHGLAQSKKFSWDESAKRTIEAFERLIVPKTAPTSGKLQRTSRRPKLAFLSPLPPAKSGIADYSAELLPELARHYEIEVVADQSEFSNPWINANFPVRSVGWFDRNADCYDRILYHFGNSEFHQHMFKLLKRHPGTVVLHDFFLGGILRHMDVLNIEPGVWIEALYLSHGYSAVKERFVARYEMDVALHFPANLEVINHANGVIVHSSFARALAETWYGPGSRSVLTQLPLLRQRSVSADRNKSRLAVGLKEEDFLVCSFGMLGPSKLNDRLLKAWLSSPLASDPHCHLVFVGQIDGSSYGEDLLTAINSNSSGRITLTGFASPALYESYLSAADVAVQLRGQSRGETSAAILDCLKAGIPTIVNRHGSAAEIPEKAVLMLEDDFTLIELSNALAKLHLDTNLRREIGEAGRMQIIENHNPRVIADLYRDAIESFAETGPQVIKTNLINSLSALQEDSAQAVDWKKTATNIAFNHPPVVRPRHLYVDVTDLMKLDPARRTKTLADGLLESLLSENINGFRTEPVYTSNDGLCRHACKFTMGRWNLPAAMKDSTVEPARSDVYVVLDASASTNHTSKHFRNLGIKIVSLVPSRTLSPKISLLGESGVRAISAEFRTVMELSHLILCLENADDDRDNRLAFEAELKLSFDKSGARLRPILEWLGLSPQASIAPLSEQVADRLRQMLKTLV